MMLFSRLFRSGHKSARDLTEEGKAHCQRGDHARALAAFSEVVRLEPANAQAYYLRASVYWLLTRECGKAIQDFTQAIRLDPGRPELFRARAEASVHAGDYAQAVADYSEVIRLAADAAAFSDRSLAYLATGECDRAIADATEAIRRDPRFAKAYFNRGSAYGTEGRYDLAVADFSKAIELDPNEPHYYASRDYFLGKADPAKGDSEHLKAIAEGHAEWLFGDAWRSRTVLPESPDQGTD
jgi:tetratricopeptide (TPR) repeat protein